MCPSLDTGIKETVYHRERIFGYTREPAQKVQMRVIQAQFSASLIDITGPAYLPGPSITPPITAPPRLRPGQKVAGADGIHYRSVRHPGHDCHVLYRPRLVSRVDHARHLSTTGRRGHHSCAGDPPLR